MTVQTVLSTPLTNSYGAIVRGTPEQNLLALDQRAIAALIERAGVVVFQGFAADTPTFKAFTELYSSDFMSYQGGGFRFRAFDRKAINNDSTLMTATGQTQDFAMPLHGEYYYFKNKPTTLWFYCAIPPASGGETTVGDGAEIFNRLSDSTKQVFKNTRIKYIRHLAEEDWHTSFQTDDLEVVRDFCEQNDAVVVVNEADRAIKVEYTCSALTKDPTGTQDIFINNILVILMAEAAVKAGYGGLNSQGILPFVVRLEDGTPIPDAVIAELKQVCESVTVPLPWQAGDLVVVDNTRMMHGRRGSPAGGKREIHVRMGMAKHVYQNSP